MTDTFIVVNETIRVSIDNAALLAVYVDQAEGSAVAAALSADSAAASANAASALVQYRYTSHSAALAALGGITADAAVEVDPDETRALRRSLYTKTGGVLVWRGYRQQTYRGTPISFAPKFNTRMVGDAVLPHYYVDIAATPGGNGRTAATAFSSWAEAAAHAGVIANGGIGGLTWGFRNGRGICRAGFDAVAYDAINQITIIGYGPGDPTIFSGCDPLDNANITAHASLANTYETTLTGHGLGRDNNLYQSVLLFQFGGTCAVRGDPLIRVQNEAQVTVAGRFWFNQADLLTPGNPVRVVFRLWDNVNAVTAPDGTLEITTRGAAWKFGGDYVKLMGLTAERSGSRNGSLNLTGKETHCAGIMIEHGQIHNGFGPSGLYEGMIFLNAQGGGYHGELNNAMFNIYAKSPGAGQEAILDWCGWIIDEGIYNNSPAAAGRDRSYAYIMHVSDGADLTDMAFQTLNNCWSRNVGVSFGSPGDSLLTTLNGFFSDGNIDSINEPMLRLNPSTKLTINRSLILNFARIAYATDIELRESVFISPRTQDGWVANNLVAGGAANIKSVDCLYVSPDIFQTVIQTTTADGGSLDFQHNVLVGPSYSMGINSGDATPTPPSIVSSDWNLWLFSEGARRIFVRHAANKTLVEWRAIEGVDANSAEGLYTAAAAYFVSGSVPTINNPDIRTTEGSLINAKLTNPLTQAEIAEMLARPQTRAEALDWLRAFRAEALPEVVEQ